MPDWRFLAVIGLLLSGTALAQSAERPFLVPPEYTETVQRARLELIALQHDRALNTLQQLPDSPEGRTISAFHAALGALVRAYSTDNRAYLADFYLHERRFRSEMEGVPPSYRRALFDAEMAYYLAMALAREQRTARAALAMRTAYRKLKEVQSRYPAEVDVLKSLGVLHVMVAASPPTHRAVLSTLGFRGSIPQGYAELQRAAAEGTVVREEAALMLALLDVVVRARYDEATRHIPQLPSAVSRTALMLHVHGFTLLSAGRASEAENAFRRAIAPQEGKEVLAYSVYFHADALLHLGRHADARRQFDRFLAAQPHRGLRLPALLRAGYAAAFAGDAEASRLYLNRVVRDGTPQSESDEEALREARRLLAQGGLQGRPLTLLNAQYALDAGQTERAEGLLSAFSGPRDSAQERVLHGRLLHQKGQLREALDVLASVTASPRAVPPQHLAAGWFHRARVHLALRQPSEARSALEALLRIQPDYPGKFTLELRARAELATLRR